MAFNEEDIINTVAKHERAIAGVRNAYNFADNPDTLSTAQLPAAVHFSPGFEARTRMHHARWANVIRVTSVLFVAPQATRGTRLRFLENSAIPYGGLWRARFQTETIVRDMLEQTATVTAFLVNGAYGAGGGAGNLLTYGEVDYIGWIFQFVFSDTGMPE